MLETLLGHYYTDFRDFKNFFVCTCEIDKKYEVYKVWAQWLIRNLSKNKENDHLMPSEYNISTDTDIITHLKDKGLRDDQIYPFYEQVKQRLVTLYDKYQQLKMNQFKSYEIKCSTNHEIEYELLNHDGKQLHIYRLGRIFVKYETHIYDRLVKRYSGEPSCFKFYMFEMGFNYYMLEGHSFQWCIPPKSMDLLGKQLSITTELFASPINASLPHYYSLFSVDQYFGASGNFFNLKFPGLSEGTYEVNPPFIEQLFIKSSKMIFSMLKWSQEQSKDLMFIYIMPDWTDSAGYQLLVQSKFLIEDITLTSNNYFYYQSSKNRLITANFVSHILIIGSDLSKRRWHPTIKDKFIEHFIRD